MSIASSKLNEMSQDIPNDTPAPLILTKSAAEKVYGLWKEENNPDLYFRLAVTGGGCSGIKYDIAFDDQIDPDNDFFFAKNFVEDGQVTECDYEEVVGNKHKSNEDVIVVVIDSISLNYYRGASIDYRMNDLGEGEFVINNPNAKTSCGCGSSFSAE